MKQIILLSDTHHTLDERFFPYFSPLLALSSMAFVAVMLKSFLTLKDCNKKLATPFRLRASSSAGQSKVPCSRIRTPFGLQRP